VGRWSAFAAVQFRGESGWRDYSSSRLASGYADLGYDGAAAGLRAKSILASTGLSGNGAAPEELLAVRRAAVFTHPDRTENRFARLSLHPWARSFTHHAACRRRSMRSGRRAACCNGDAADIEPCEAEPGLLCLETEQEGEEQAEVLTDRLRPPDHCAGGRADICRDESRRTVLARLRVARADHRPGARCSAGSTSSTLGTSLDYGRSAFAAETALGTLDGTRGVQEAGPVIVQANGAMHACLGRHAATFYAGFFAAETLPLGPRLRLEAGLRYNHAAIQLDDKIGTALNGRHHSAAQPRVGARLGRGVRPFAACQAMPKRTVHRPRQSFPAPIRKRPGSSADFFVADPPLRQVVARTWELGAAGKGNAGGWRLEWLASFYRADSRDEIRRVASGVRGRAYSRTLAMRGGRGSNSR
jgi:hypothetical protein